MTTRPGHRRNETSKPLPGWRRPDHLGGGAIERPDHRRLAILDLHGEHRGVRQSGLVEGDVARWRLERALVERRANLLAVDGAGLLDRLHDDEIGHEARHRRGILEHVETGPIEHAQRQLGIVAARGSRPRNFAGHSLDAAIALRLPRQRGRQDGVMHVHGLDLLLSQLLHQRHRHVVERADEDDVGPRRADLQHDGAEILEVVGKHLLTDDLDALRFGLRRPDVVDRLVDRIVLDDEKDGLGLRLDGLEHVEIAFGPARRHRIGRRPHVFEAALEGGRCRDVAGHDRDLVLFGDRRHRHGDKGPVDAGEHVDIVDRRHLLVQAGGDRRIALVVVDDELDRQLLVAGAQKDPAVLVDLVDEGVGHLVPVRRQARQRARLEIVVPMTIGSEHEFSLAQCAPCPTADGQNAGQQCAEDRVSHCFPPWSLLARARPRVGKSRCAASGAACAAHISMQPLFSICAINCKPANPVTLLRAIVARIVSLVDRRNML